MPEIDGTLPCKPALLFLLILPVVTFISTYTISLSTGAQYYPYLFLSVSIEAKPASCIGTFGLSATCLLAPVMAFVRNSHVRKHATAALGQGSDDYLVVKKWNKRAVVAAVLTGIGGHGVASFQSTVDDCGGEKWIVGVHLIFATIFFFSGAAYCFISHKLDLLLPTLGTPSERRLRKIFTYGTITQFIIVCVFFPILVISVGAPDWVIALMSFFEVTLLATFMSTYLTFLKEMEHLKVQLMVFSDEERYSLHVSERAGNGGKI